MFGQLLNSLFKFKLPNSQTFELRRFTLSLIRTEGQNPKKVREDTSLWIFLKNLAHIEVFSKEGEFLKEI